MQPAGKLDSQDWLQSPETIELMHALMAGGKTARFVGGCVRNSLLQQPISDIDIATAESPEQVMVLLKAAGIHVIPVGIEHGSVLAVHGQAYNITTLRADVETTGRHAVVSYIDDWSADAMRRDFTMNALYADLDGTFYDPCNGLPDLQEGRIRFIGDAQTRIREDYLRILRFFRFQAYYGKTPPENAHLEACRQNADGLKMLSKQRVWYEIRKLLLAENPLPALNLMVEHGIWTTIKTKGLPKLLALEQQYQAPKSAIRRLACLMGPKPRILNEMNLSNDEFAHLTTLVKLMYDGPDLAVEFENTRLLYELGPDVFLDYILLTHENIETSMEHLRHWTSPKLPVRGQDLLDLGMGAGPEIGNTIKELTDWWLHNACKPDKTECLQWVKTRNKL